MFGAVADNLLIGVVGSLIATVIVFLVTQLREYIRHQKRIKSANLFVIDRLRAYIVNADIPPDDILNALRKSAARKFELREYELWPISTYVEEIVAEIIGNVYLKIEEQTSSYLEKANVYLAKHKIQIQNQSLQRQSDKVNLQWRIISLFILFVTFLAFYVFVTIFDFLIYDRIEKMFIFQNYYYEYYNFPLFSQIVAITITATFFNCRYNIFPQNKKKNHFYITTEAIIWKGRHIFNRDVFKRMKNTAMIINTAREPIISQTDLAWVLENGEILYAGLDTVEEEPIHPDDPLLKMDKHCCNLGAHEHWNNFKENSAAQPEVWQK